MDKKRQQKLFSLFNISVLISALLLSFYLLFAYFSDSASLSGRALDLGLFGIFLFAFLLEVSIQFIGPDILLASGIIANINLFSLLLMIWLGSWLAGIVGYYIGLQNGERIIELFTSKRKFHKAVLLFQKYGKFSLTIVAMTPLPYFPIAAGIFRLKFLEFVLYALIPRTLWYLVVAYLLNTVL